MRKKSHSLMALAFNISLFLTFFLSSTAFSNTTSGKELIAYTKSSNNDYVNTSKTIIRQTSCEAEAGTLTADADKACIILVEELTSLEFNEARVRATPNGNAIIPLGFRSLFLLTQGTDLVIIDSNTTPNFQVTLGGNYRIHTLVYDLNTLDLNIIDIGNTKIDDISIILIQGGGDTCGALDVIGAKILVEGPDADILTIDANPVVLDTNLEAILSATPQGKGMLPPGYNKSYLLTQGPNSTIINSSISPSFVVNSLGDYRIHELVYDPLTLDLNVIEYDVTTALDVLNLFTSRGGDICGSLDTGGAKVSVVEAPCIAETGTLTADADIICFSIIEEFTGLVNTDIEISATPNGDILVPFGFNSIFLLSQGFDSVIMQMGMAPVFEVGEGANYGIHTLVYNPNTLDISLIETGGTRIGDISEVLKQGGGSICGSLDVTGAKIVVEAPDADMLTIDTNPVVLDTNLEATLSATPQGLGILPPGYNKLYLLTQGPNLTIINSSISLSFVVNSIGDYRIHELVYNPLTLDLNVIEYDVTTALDVLNLFISRGGDICGSIDIGGTKVSVVEAPCVAETGNLTADFDSVCLIIVEEFTGLLNNEIKISAIPNGDIVEPNGFESVFLLSQGFDSVIMQTGMAPVFEVREGANYGIHTLVYNPNTLDLSLIEIGGTRISDISEVLNQGGGNICGSLDVIGAKILVEAPNADILTINTNPVVLDTNLEATLSATPQGVGILPPGYNKLYLLTQGSNSTIIDSSISPSFVVNSLGDYRIHELVYDPLTLDLNVIEYEVTTALDVLNLFTSRGGDICGSIETGSMKVTVDEAPCITEAGTLTADVDTFCLERLEEFTSIVNNELDISATPNGDILIPFGFESIFLLSQGFDSVIMQTGVAPVFEVSEGSNYGIHTLVFNPNTLDLSLIELGETRIGDFSGILKQGGGNICGSLDVIGAKIVVEAPIAGLLKAEVTPVILDTNGTTISATPNGTNSIPENYNKAYLLTQGSNLVIKESAPTPNFVVNSIGNYRIHELVYNPITLDLNDIDFEVTKLIELYNLLTIRGGDICGSLDTSGAPVSVIEALLSN